MKRGIAGPRNQTVLCKCGDTSASGLFEVDGRHLVLRSDFGTSRVLLGLQEPRTLAKKLMKNICLKAIAAGEPSIIEPPVANGTVITEEPEMALTGG